MGGPSTLKGSEWPLRPGGGPAARAASSMLPSYLHHDTHKDCSRPGQESLQGGAHSLQADKGYSAIKHVCATSYAKKLRNL